MKNPDQVWQMLLWPYLNISVNLLKQISGINLLCDCFTELKVELPIFVQLQML